MLTGLSQDSLNGSIGVVCGPVPAAGGRIPVHVAAEGKGKRLLVRLRNLRPSDQAARVPAAYALAAWLRVVDPAIELSHALSFAKVEGRGVSVVALAPIKVGTRLLTIPAAQCLSANAAHVRGRQLAKECALKEGAAAGGRRVSTGAGEHVTMGSLLDELGLRAATRTPNARGNALDLADVQLMLVVMNVLAHDGRLRATWPSAAELRSMPILWTDEEAALLAGTAAGWVVSRLRREVAEWYSIMEGVIMELGCMASFTADEHALGPTNDLRHTFLVALSIVKSRAIVAPGSALTGGGGGGETIVIPPLVDLLNGTPSRETCYRGRNVEFTGSGAGGITVMAVSDIDAGEECVACYGEDSSAAFLLKYGMVMPWEEVAVGKGCDLVGGRNPNDVIWLRVDPAMLPLEDDTFRMDALRAIGFIRTSSDGQTRAEHAAPQIFELSRRQLDRYLLSQAEGEPEEPRALQQLKYVLLLLVAPPDALIEARGGGELRVSRQAVSAALQTLLQYNASLIAAPSTQIPQAPTNQLAGVKCALGDQMNDAVAPRAAAADNADDDSVGVIGAKQAFEETSASTVCAAISAQARRAREVELQLLSDWQRALAPDSADDTK